MAHTSNKATWESREVFETYAHQTALQKPEERILDRLQNELPRMKMLDVGIGTGRTTLHFSNRVREYVGIDYSQPMIDECRRRFPESFTVSFHLCDVTSMEMFEDNTFDFVLFSFNGIDYLSHEERLKAFREIRRVGKRKGSFCFSSHNLQSVDKILALRDQFGLHPSRTTRKLIRWYRLRFLYNRGVDLKQIKSRQYAIFNDGASNYGLQTCYIKPDEQIRQLSENFEDIRVFSLDSGEEIENTARLHSADDSWLYYLCVIK